MLLKKLSSTEDSLIEYFLNLWRCTYLLSFGGICKSLLIYPLVEKSSWSQKFIPNFHKRFWNNLFKFQKVVGKGKTIFFKKLCSEQARYF